jgi:uncharacterized protein (DUF362 family)
MKRREFLKFQAAGAFCLAAGGAGLLLPSPVLAAPGPDLAVVTGRAEAATRAAVGLLGGMGRFVKTGNKVVIKPNMSFGRGPESGTTTHPGVVLALATLCAEAGASRVLILDHTLEETEECLEGSGIRAACEKLGSGLVQGLSAERFYTETDIPGGVDMKANRIMADVLSADVLIAAPVAKSHSSTGVSLSLKGMMGLVLDRSPMHSRYDLDTAIVDLNSRLKARLTVIDATRVLSTNGPSGPGKVLAPDTVIASADPVAADAYAVSAFEWYGKRFAPRQVRHVRLAAERGLGRMDLENLSVRQVSL